MAPRSAVPSPAAAPRPAHLRASAIALVLVGGTLGTAVREGVSLILGTDSEFPLGILAVNLLGDAARDLLDPRLKKRAG